MMKQNNCAAVGLLVMVLAFSSGAEERKGGSFRIETRLQDGWLFEYTPDDQPYSLVQIEGKRHILFEGSASLDPGTDHTGEPLLPVTAVTLGIPHGAILQIEVLEADHDVIENQLIAPYPTYTVVGDQEPVAEFKKNPTAYGRNAFFPSRELVVESPQLFRDQWISSVRISPYHYNPATRQLKRLRRAKLLVRVRDASGQPMILPQSLQEGRDPFFEETYRSIISNYGEARGWRVRDVAPDGMRLFADSTRDWFETGKNYYKMSIAADGWYKVSKAQLVEAGANPSLIDLPTLKVFYRGAQIPIVVRADTSVEFFGRKNRGDSTFTDFFTDTSAYWLTWGGTPGLRFVPSFVDSSGIIPNIQTSFFTKHFEQNNYYFQGTTQPDIINVETIPGEGWAWGNFDEWFFPNATREYQFVLDTVEVGETQAARLRVRLVSTTPNFANPNHRARVWLNDSLAGEVTFPGRTTYVMSVSVPHSWLKSGTNRLKIQSLPTSAQTNQFYLDWFEVDYSRSLRVQSANYLPFSFSWSGAGSKISYTASGFTTPQVDVFDLSSGRQITSANTMNAGGTYSIVFRDTLSAARSYVVVGAGGAVAVPSVTQKMFSDIRSNSLGADYIIITHKNFLSAAQQLAAHRQSVNGVRTKVVDIQDIYDEFNYGILNATVVKSFTRYAFQNWPVPKPAYLLLFGDACWDYHGFLTSTVNSNFVPSYGVPASDNWFVTFNPDTVSMPSMLVGRIPVETESQASSVVQKLIGYDAYELAEWNKNFLFITGGINPSEQNQFNAYSEYMIDSLVVSPPIGGNALRVYKSTRGVIDGENKEKLKEYVRNGLVFMNFIGHSGGRIWGVDIGPPSELENTDGKLPFVASVSCNVGGFAEPSSNVLAEDFLLAENRGSIATWASSSLGYPSYGRDLVRDFLQGVRDSVRTLGALTTNAKLKMLRTYGSDYIANATVHTNNLLGDPLSRFALPLTPELAVHSNNIISNNPAPTVNDSLVLLKVKMFNYGLVPSDSVGVTVTDMYNGQTTNLLSNKKIAPMRLVDSITVEWRGQDQVGVHTIAVSLDPQNAIPEVSELNNIASVNQYVYANSLAIVKPIRNMVVPSGIQRLVVTSPVGVDSLGFAYEFQLDTVDSFDSPVLVSSGGVSPGAVTGEWLTPSLDVDRVYFWRARTTYGQTLGRWVESSFSTSSDVPLLPTVRWRENSAKQFRRDVLTQASATDSGVTIATTPPIDIYVRSVGGRYNLLAEYYSTIRINEQKISGYWWEVGNSFMVARINDFSGAVEFKTFNLLTFPPDSGQREAQRMADFLNQTPVGNYVAWSVIFDGATNVSESLYVAMERLGSTRARTVYPDSSWAFIGRKGSSGPGMVALESVTRDTAVVSMQIPNYYSYGIGSVAVPSLFIPNSWESFHWRQSGPQSTNSRIGFIGVRPNGSVDTLRIFPKDSLDIDLSFLNPLTSGARYTSMKVAGLLSTTDALVSPVLQDWWMDVSAPADLAVSARTIAGADPTAARNVEITVYNIGFVESDSAEVVLSVYDRQNRARQLATVPILPIAVGSSRTVTIPISTTNLPRRVTLQAAVIPAKKSKDLVAENNSAFYSLDVGSALAGANIQVYADGAQVMDGDFIPASPVLAIHLSRTSEVQPVRSEVQMFVDDRLVGISTQEGAEIRPMFSPTLSDGTHLLTFKVRSVDSYGEIDTTQSTLNVRVSSEGRILHLTNYPNPFARETHFTFMLAGSTPPQRLTLRIYTISGRKIREITVPSHELRVGSNRVFWDGRDADGDEIANGYYFFQALLEGEGNVQSEVQRLVKVR